MYFKLTVLMTHFITQLSFCFVRVSVIEFLYIGILAAGACHLVAQRKDMLIEKLMKKLSLCFVFLKKILFIYF